MAKAKRKTKKKAKPISNGSNGRNGNGTFSKGNQLSKGHKSSSNVHAMALKKVLLETVTEKDMRAIVNKLVKLAMAGDIAAIKELFDRCLGRPLQTHEVDVEVKTYTPEQCDSIRKLLAGRCVNAEP